jgi:CDP-4-dehydro-6-deoxyglucose reductase
MPTLTVLPQGLEIGLRPGDTVLAAVARAGYRLRTGCRRGGCGYCVVDVVAGVSHDERTVPDTALPAEERAAGAVLACRAVPDGDVTVRVRRPDDVQLVSPLMAELARAALARERERASAA